MTGKDLFDPYSLKARFLPAVLAVAPIVIVGAAYLPGIDWAARLASLGTVGIAASWWLADIARGRGKRVEERLSRGWGVLPSVAMLRHRDTTFNRHETEAHHRAAQPLVEPMRLPTADEERDDPDEADRRYTRVNNVARERTRDSSVFKLLFKENVNYGFRRNMLGLRPIALWVLTGVLGFLVWQSWEGLVARQLPPPRGALLVLGTVGLMLLWWLAVTERSVQAVARDYARQLLMALESVKPPDA